MKRCVKVGLYFRRRQALWHAFTRLSNPYKSVCGVSVYTFHAGISARQRARESVARRKMLQSSTVLNFHALRQRTQAIQPIIYRCHELSLQRTDLAITSENSHWTISSWCRSRKAHVIAVRVQSWPCWSNWGFRSCIASPNMTVFPYTDSCLSHSRSLTGWWCYSRLQINHWHNYKLNPFAN